MPIARTPEHTAMRKLLMRYMAEYTNNSSAPANIRGGFFAIHITDTNMVWVNETGSFASTLQRWKNKGTFADCVGQAIKRGAKLELWFLTQPQRFCVNELKEELSELNKIAERKERVMSGPGKLYSIRHAGSMDFFLLADRINTAPTSLLSNFVTRLQTMRGDNRNQLLDQFVSEQTSDIIKGTGFDITHIDDFDSCEDLWLKRQVYIDDNKFGRNLNWHNVD
ncbi:hypothetical protein ST201phi2-1p421 [Pseudomonas phage 201phi2-1]|uniref:Uncharacterized protein n=1 Tax=Pseudomonas phage 201phi2-1 TaxID=198110 RepID=B3FJT0_BP201|nr:hypothetical protein ST201phi2-1p421 [Pseudomonas phage 201phi2-1]ABY63245.1 hypothetical protein 201phi2-1p421 [Pseudomonas phage 201phi2-1]